MSKYYHATEEKNIPSILNEGIRPGCDGSVYLTKDPKDAQKFLWVRGIKKIYVIEVNVDDSNVKESFDHNPVFFQCRAYSHSGRISTKLITNITLYNYE